MSDESKMADAGRRRMVLAGIALSVLSVASLGCSRQPQAQAQQPSPTPSSPPAAGNIVMVAPTDTIAAIQTKLNSVPAGGTLAFPANSAFNFNGRTLRGKDNVTVWADGVVSIDGAAGPGSSGAFDFGGRSGWTVRGKGAGQGFVFNGGRINASKATNGTIINCVFNDTVYKDDNGVAVALSGAGNILIANCDFNRVRGNALGNYDMDQIVVNGCHFVDCRQVASYNCFTSTSGNGMQFINCYVNGEGRGGIETGGDSMFFKDFLVQGCTFVNNKGPAEIGCISMVARGTVTNTRIVNNYFERGAAYFNLSGSPDSCGIEAMVGCIATGNTFVDFSVSFLLWDGSSSPVQGPTQGISGNKVFNSGDSWGSQVLTTRPTAPMPPRMVWP